MDFSTGLDCHPRRRPTPAAERQPVRLAASHDARREEDRKGAETSRKRWGLFYPEAPFK